MINITHHILQHFYSLCSKARVGKFYSQFSTGYDAGWDQQFCFIGRFILSQEFCLKLLTSYAPSSIIFYLTLLCFIMPCTKFSIFCTGFFGSGVISHLIRSPCNIRTATLFNTDFDACDGSWFMQVILIGSHW